MTERVKLTHLTEEEYLKAEEKSEVRHEYVNGYVFAMSSSTDAHNLVSGNIFSVIHANLRGSQCRAYIHDMKLKLAIAKSYYYPDIMVSCEPFESKSVFKHAPVLIVEVLSPSTASVDRREKLMAYQHIPSLREYLIVYQDRQKVELYRKDSQDQWELMIIGSDDDLVLESLPNGPLQLPFSLIYDGYNPPSRVKEDDVEYQFEESLN